MDRDKLERIALLASPAEKRRPTQISGPQDRLYNESKGNFSGSPIKDIWGRIDTDIVTFLAAMESLSSNDSDGNYEALLEATDRLLWASARTRLELERVLAHRKKGASLRRISG